MTLVTCQLYCFASYLITENFDLTVASVINLRVPGVFERVNLYVQR